RRAERASGIPGVLMFVQRKRHRTRARFPIDNDRIVAPLPAAGLGRIVRSPGEAVGFGAGFHLADIANRPALPRVEKHQLLPNGDFGAPSWIKVNRLGVLRADHLHGLFRPRNRWTARKTVGRAKGTPPAGSRETLQSGADWQPCG